MEGDHHNRSFRVLVLVKTCGCYMYVWLLWEYGHCPSQNTWIISVCACAHAHQIVEVIFEL